MSNAFGISEDDILVAIEREGFGSVVTDVDLARWFGDLDHEDIEHAAMNYDDMDAQTNAAQDNISTQLQDMGVYGELKARLSSKEMEASTAAAPPSAPISRP